MKPSEKYVESFDGTSIFYEMIGTGEPLVMLHGNGGSSRYFHRQIPVFAKFYQLILVDSRGHGRSGNKQAKLSFQMMAQDILAILNAEKIDKAHLLGYSDGANLAMVFAANYKEKLRSLVLDAGNVSPSGVMPKVVRRAHLGSRTLHLASRLLPVAKKAALWLDLITHDIGIKYEDLACANVPALVVAGEHDIILPAETQKIAAALPHSQLVIVPKGKHRLAVQMPEVFNQLVLSFLGKVTKL